jgi:hypothetical protein
MNEFGPFFPADTLDRPTTSDARSAKAAQLVRVLPEFGAFLDSYRTKILEALRAEQLA